MAQVKQLVVRSKPGSNARTVEAVETGFMGRPSLGAYDYTPLFGTSDLVELAFALRNASFEITGVGLSDDDFIPVEDHDESDLEKRFTIALQDRDAGIVRDLLDEHYRGLRIAYLEVRSPAGARFTVSRDGSVRLPTNKEYDSFLSFMSNYITTHG